MVDEVVDQSLFSSQQAVLQAPPVKELNPENQLKNKKKKKWMMIIGLTMMTIIALSIVAAMSIKHTNDPLLTPTPLPTTTVTETQKQQELKRVKTAVEAANPEMLLIVPPMVDMEVILY